MRNLKQGDVYEVRGVWTTTAGMGGLTTLVSCPCCGFIINLTGNTIEKEFVKPELRCVVCNFEGFVRLEGWPGTGKKS